MVVPHGRAKVARPLLAGERRTTMKRGYRKATGTGKRESKIRRIARQAMDQAEQVQLPLTIESLVKMAQESLSSFAVEVGLRVAQCLLEDEVVRRCGERYQRPADRSQTRYGHQGGFVTIAGQKLPIRKPR